MAHIPAWRCCVHHSCEAGCLGTVWPSPSSEASSGAALCTPASPPGTPHPTLCRNPASEAREAGFGVRPHSRLNCLLSRIRPLMQCLKTPMFYQLISLQLGLGSVGHHASGSWDPMHVTHPAVSWAVFPQQAYVPGSRGGTGRKRVCPEQKHSSASAVTIADLFLGMASQGWGQAACGSCQVQLMGHQSLEQAAK